MRSNRVLAASVFVVAYFAMVAAALADAVAVGSSTLISTLDYSDTFTIDGTTRIDNVFPPSAAARAVENCYGNTPQTWGNYIWSLNTASTASNFEGAVYPGNSNAGSVGGFTQTGGIAEEVWGVNYNLRTNYVVQFDAVTPYNSAATAYAIIATGSAIDSSTSPNGLAVLFGNDGSVLLRNGTVGDTTVSAITTGLTSTQAWHNFAVKFDLDHQLLDVYVDQVDKGQINLNTFDGGLYGAQVSSATNDYVSVGAKNGVRIWTDNFQVGSATPEPSAIALLVTGLIGLLAYAWRKRRQ